MRSDLNLLYFVLLAAVTVTAVAFAAIREVHLRRRLSRLSSELDLQEQRLRQVVYSSPVAAVVFDDRGIVRKLNPAGERLFGATEDHVAGHNFQGLVRFGEAAPVLNFQATARLHINVKATACRGNGAEFPAEVSIHQLFPRREEAFAALVVETQTKPETGRIEDLERRARRLAVELNDMLTKIVGYADLLRENVAEDQRNDFEQITEAGQRAAALGNQLLNLKGNGKVMAAAAGAGAAGAFRIA